MALIRDAVEADWDWILRESAPIGGPKIVSQGFVHNLRDYPALIAQEGDVPTGFVVYQKGQARWVILAIRSMEERRGLGSQMLDAVETLAQSQGAEKLRLSTTNDNLPALRFCQLRGYRMRQLIPNAYIEAKLLKGIPKDEIVRGRHGIEIRDEIVLNKDL
jgi:GNAT superfamily N-acetyltransferase